MMLRLNLFAFPALCQLLILPIRERCLYLHMWGINIQKTIQAFPFEGELFAQVSHLTGSNSEIRSLVLHLSAHD